MPILHKNITAETDIHNPKWFSNANNGDYAWKNEQGNLESIDELLLPAALNFVDGSVAPPTSNVGDIYVLSSGGSVDAGWGSVSLQDWVRYDGAAWNSITPQKSSLCYNENSDTLLSFNGLAWAAIGGGIDNVTSAEKAALSPNTGDFVYDTDLNSLQRYDGSNWVDIAKGYGVIEVITDSDNGVPTYFTDLQTALETCKTSGSNNVVKLYSNISLPSQININSGGSSGIGNNYNFESLTIDFNGFEVSFDDAGTADVFSIVIGGNPSNNQKIIFLNGKISRINGTGTHRCIDMPATQYGTINMSKMLIYCQNSQAANIANLIGTEENNQNNDFGGSIFVSDASSGDTCGFLAGDNFKVISLGNSNGFRIGTNKCRNVYVECKGTGNGILGSGTLYDSHVQTNSGDCISGTTKIHNCNLISTSGHIIDSGSGAAEIYNSHGETGNSNALDFVAVVDNCVIINNSSSDTILFPSDHRNSTFINKGSGKVANINFNTRIFDNCILISEGGVPVTTAGACNGVFKNCNIKSNWNNASGHAMTLNHSSNTVYVANCILEVANSSANCLYAASAKTAAVGNCGFKGATTAINANVTVSLTSAPDANGNYEL
jgi:hypothetical protein